MTRNAYQQWLRFQQRHFARRFTAQAARSVHDAGCELEPEWADGAMLLVPLTEELVCESGIQLTHTHIVAMARDVENIRQALKAAAVVFWRMKIGCGKGAD